MAKQIYLFYIVINLYELKWQLMLSIHLNSKAIQKEQQIFGNVNLLLR